MMATCLAVVLLMVTFAYVTDLEESDAVEIGGITKIGSLDYLVVDGTVRHDDSMFDGHSRIYVTTSGDSTEIAADAFNGCDSIDMIQIDDKVTTVGDRAFANMSELYYVYGRTVTELGDHVFQNSTLEACWFGEALETIGAGAFEDTTELMRFQIEETSVTELREDTFRNSGIELLDLRNMTSIDGSAFTGSSLTLHVVRTGQKATVDGVDRLYFDGDMDYYETIRSVNKKITVYFYSLNFFTVTDMDGNELNVTYRHGIGSEHTGSFNPVEGKDYHLNSSNAVIHIPEGMGIEETTVVLAEGRTSYTLPTARVGDLTSVGWKIEGVSGTFTTVDRDTLIATGGEVYATPVFGDLTMTLDHSGISGYSDVSGLPTQHRFTYGGTYPDLDDIKGYAFDGWLVGDTRYGPGDPVTEYRAHTAVSQWVPSEYMELIYTDASGGTISTEQYAYNHTAKVDASITTTGTEIQDFVGWSLDGATVLTDDDPITMSSDVTLIPVFQEKPRCDIVYYVDGGIHHSTYGHLGVESVLDAEVPKKVEGIFDHWSCSDGNEYGPGDGILLTGDVTLTAVWRERESLPVTYMNGDERVRVDTATEGLPYKVPFGLDDTDTQRFDGWADVDGDVFGIGDEMVLFEGATLTAVFSDRTEFYVTYTIDGVPESEVYIKGATHTVTSEVPKKDGMYFVGWKDQDGTIHSAGEQITVMRDLRLTAEFRGPYSYDITFVDPFGETVVQSKTEDVAFTVTLEPDDTDTHIFVCWRDTEGSAYDIGDEITDNSPLTLTAEYRERIQYTVTYVVGDGSEKVTALEGLTHTVGSDLPVPDGMVFMGWEDRTGRHLADGEEVTVDGDLTITAKLRPLEKYAIGFTGPDGQRTELTKTEGIPLEVPDIDDTDTGIFVCWRDADGGEYLPGDMITTDGPMELESIYRDRETVRFTFVDADGSTVLGEEQGLEGIPHTIELVPESEGLIFVQWTADGKGYPAGTEIVTDADITLTAKWRAPETYDVTFVDPYGETVVLTKTERVEFVIATGCDDTSTHIFVCWKDEDGTSYDVGDVLAEDVPATLTAEYRERLEFTVTYDVDGLTETEPAIEGLDYTVREDTPASEGKVFTGWLGYDGTAYIGGDTFVAEGDVTLTAQFRDLYTYEMTFTDPYGETVVLTKTEGVPFEIPFGCDDTGTSIFVCWTDSDGTEYSEGDVFDRNSPMEFTATYRDRIQYTITYVIDGSEETVEVLERLTHTVRSDTPVSEGMVFTGWVDQDGSALTGGETIVVDGDVTITAQFRPLERYTITLTGPDRETFELTKTEDVPLELPTLDDTETQIFEGWETDDGDLYGPGDRITVNGPISLGCVYRDRVQYTISYIVDGVTDEDTALEGLPYTVRPDIPVSDGNVFLHWSGSDGATYHGGESFVAIGDFSLTANFRPLEQYTITLTGLDGTVTELTKTEDVPLELPMLDDTDTQIFEGWMDGDGDIYGPGDSVTANGPLELDPVFRDRVPYTVTYVVADSSTEVTVLEGLTHSVISDPDVPDGSAFVSWTCSDGNSYTGGEIVTVSEDLVLTAQLRGLDSYAMTFTDPYGETMVLSKTEGVPFEIPFGCDDTGTGIFVGWTDTDGNRYSVGDFFSEDSDMTFTAEYRDRAAYTVTYVVQGMTTADTALEGIPYTVSDEVPVMEGHRFTSWIDTLGTEHLPGDTIDVAGDLELTAQFRPLEQYTVTLIGPDDEIIELTKTEGVPLELPDLEDTDTQIFVGWRDGDGDMHEPGDPVIEDSDMGFTAVYRDRTVYTVTYVVGDGASTDTALEGIPYTVTSNVPEMDGHRFTCWMDDLGTEHQPGDEIPVIEDIELTAQFRPLDEYTVTFIGQDGTVTELTKTEDVPLKLPDLDDTETQIFVGWKDVDGIIHEPGDEITANGPMELESVFRDRIRYTVTYIVGDETSTDTASEGLPYTISTDAPISDGNVFVDWSGSDGSSYDGGDTVIVTGDLTLTANFRPLGEYSVTLVNPDGSVTELTKTEDVPLELPVLDDTETQIFVGWRDGNGNLYGPGDSMTANGPLELDPVFRDRTPYTVTYVIGETVETETVLEGLTHTVHSDPAVPDGFGFTIWTCSDGTEYTGGETVTVNGDMTFTAQLRELDEHRIVFTGPDGEKTEIDVTEGETVSVPDLDDTDTQIFVGWRDGDGNIHEPNTDIPVDGDMELVPEYRDRIPYTVTYVIGETVETETVLEGLTHTIRQGADAPTGYRFVDWTDGDGNSFVGLEEVIVLGDIVLTAAFEELDRYTVTFTGPDGEKTVMTQTEDVPVVLPDSEDTDTQIFMGWRDGDGNIHLPGDEIDANGPAELTAEYRDRLKVEITFLDSDGTTVLHTMEGLEGIPMAVSFAPENETARDFDRWTSPDGKDVRVGDEIAVDVDTVLTAFWTVFTVHTVTYDTDAEPNVFTIREGGTHTVIGLDGTATMRFLGWSVSDDWTVDHREDDVITPDADITLHPVWQRVHTGGSTGGSGGHGTPSPDTGDDGPGDDTPDVPQEPEDPDDGTDVPGGDSGDDADEDRTSTSDMDRAALAAAVGVVALVTAILAVVLRRS